MPAAGQRKTKTSGTTGAIRAVKNPINFFTLVLFLLVEVGLGSLALKAKGENQLIVTYGILVIILALIVVVTLLAWKRQGALLGTADESTQLLEELREFCKAVSGEWWEKVTPKVPAAISYVEITPYLGMTTVKLKGDAYAEDGSHTAQWNSVASCVNLQNKTIFYQWEGLYPDRPQERFGGFGKMEFYGALERASGDFMDTNLTNWSSSTNKSIMCVRASKAETQIVRDGDAHAIAELVAKKLKQISG
jgi:hypothetical protein